MSEQAKSAHDIHEQIIEQAQEKILQAKSAQEIKNLIKQNDPFGLDTVPYDFQDALSRLVSQHIMKQFAPEEITRIERIPHRILNTELGGELYIYNSNRSIEVSKLALKLDDDITRSIVLNAAKRHDPFTISQFERHFNPPDNNVEKSIFNAVYKLLENNPGISATDRLKGKNPYFDETVEKIFDSVLPKIRHERNMSNFNLEDKKIKTNNSTDAGYVQGVCECVAVIGDNHDLGKKLLIEMKVTKDMAKKYANPETFKALEQGIFAPKPEQEQIQSIK